MTASSRPLGLALAALGLGASAAALTIGGWGGGEWGPRTVPLLAAVALLASGVAVAFSPSPSVLSPSAASSPAAEGKPVADDPATDEWRVAALLALAVLYALAVDRVGYLVATALVAPVAFRLFGVRRPLLLLLAATLVPLALHLAFFRVLGVFPPYGSWFDLLDHVPL